MESVQRENRVLRIAVVVLFCVVLAGIVTGQQTQKFPGPGSGIVDVQVVKPAEVVATQKGEWRVTQLGDWQVRGTVATLPAMPPFVGVGRIYAVRGPSIEMVVTVRELHPSGWARVTDETRQERWINLAAMSTITAR